MRFGLTCRQARRGRIGCLVGRDRYRNGCRGQGDPGISLTLWTVRLLRFGFHASSGIAMLGMHRAETPTVRRRGRRALRARPGLVLRRVGNPDRRDHFQLTWWRNRHSR